MTYHYGSSTPSVQTQRTTINTQTDQEAPPGFHYMPDGTLMSDDEHERLYGQTVVGTGKVFDKKFINNLNISQKNIPIGGESRGYTVTGDEGANYYISVKKGTDNKFYNFTTNTFASTNNNAHVKVIGASGVDTGVINFPSESKKETYTVTINKMGTSTINNVEKLTQSIDADNNAELVFGKKIFQYTDITATLSLFSANSHWSDFPTSVTITKPRDFTSSGSIDRSTRFDINWTVTMSSGNGMIIARQPLVSDFRATSSTTVATTNSDASTEIEVTSIDNVPIGSAVTGTDIGSDGLSATSTVVNTKVVNGQNIVVLSNTQTVVSGRTLTFSNEGIDAIRDISGANLKIENLSVELQDVTTAVNGAVSSSANVTVDSSNGIIASATTFVSGIGVVGSGCTATTRRPHVDAINTGTNVMTLSVAQTLPDDTPLTITGSSRTAIIKGNGTITNIGHTNSTISLNLDNFLTQS
tara:strand:- start:3511 stop:4923 length:1413 start_codon:yes stop_codon:yes gene_type:complete